MIAGVEKVLALIPTDAKIIPGHGPLSSPTDVRKFVEMLKETRNLVATAAAEGKNAEQMKKDKILAKYGEFGKGFIKTDAWIDLLYADVHDGSSRGPGYLDHGHAGEH